MNTFNIIEKFDPNILMENIIIMNQNKILSTVFDNFNKDFNNIPVHDINIETFSISLDKSKIINWEYFIRLLNIKTHFYAKEYERNCNSIQYLILLSISSKNCKLVEFLLKLPKNIIDWDSNIYMIVSNKQFYSTNIINILLYDNFVDNEFWYQSSNNKTPIGYLFSLWNEFELFELVKYNKFNINIQFMSNGTMTNIINKLIQRKFIKILEYIFENYSIDLDLDAKNTIVYNSCVVNSFEIIKLLIKKGFNFDFIIKNKKGEKIPVYEIKSETIFTYIMTNSKIKFNNKLFYLIICKNWSTSINEYMNSELIDWEDWDFKWSWVIAKLISNEHYYMALVVMSKNLKIICSNIHESLEICYLNPHGFWEYNDYNNNKDKDNKDK